jgi:hypothetical protein
MAQIKIYPSTQAQVQAVQNTVDEINSKVNGVSLNNVGIAVTDFLNDEITIISGGLESIKRIITT